MKRLYYIFVSILLIISQLLCCVQAQTQIIENYDINIIDLPVEQVAEVGFEHQASQEAILSGSLATLYSSSMLEGQGTKESPYLITDAADLAYFRQRINSSYDTEAYYKLTSNIDLGGAEWTPIGFYSEKTAYSSCFAGHFDGDGHTIKNFKITTAKNRYIGFFGFTFGATIQNLTLSDFSIDISYSDYLYVGSLIGRCIADGEGDTSNILNCSVSGSVKAVGKGYQAYAGGLCGYVISNAKSSTNIENCTSNVDVKANLVTTSTETLKVYSGGLIGYMGCTNSSTIDITNCASTGDVNSFNNTSGAVSAFSGGFIGYAGTGSGIADESSQVNITKCYSSGQTRSSSLYTSYCGGFIGSYFLFGGTFNIANCYSSGNAGAKTLSAEKDKNYTCVGGFIGYAQSYNGNNSSITSCYASGNIADEGSDYSYYGRFAGYSFYTAMNNCYGFQTQLVSGHEIFDSVPVVLSETDCYNSEKYKGFDFELCWEFASDSEYLLPQIKGLSHVGTSKLSSVTFMNEQETFLYYPEIAYAQKITPPQSNPSKPEDETFRYKFKGWSLTPDGKLFNFNTTPIFEDTTLYAVFSSNDLSSWNGAIAESFMYGDGTQDNPYLIYTPEELALLADKVNRGNSSYARAYYSLKNYIYLGENNWTPIGNSRYPFKGVFLGNGYSISSFEIKSGDFAGIFGYINNAVIDGLSVTDFVIDINHSNASTEYLYVGVIAAHASNTKSSPACVISRCAVTDGTVTVKSATSSICAAGIVGNVDASKGSVTIQNCFSDTDISATSQEKSVYAGGIAAKMSMDADSSTLIENCYSLGQVYGSAKASCFAGGIAGHISSTGSWIEVSSDATLSADSADIMILNSFAVGNVNCLGSVNVYAGNITGFANAYAKVQNCHYPVSQTLTTVSSSSSVPVKTTTGTKTSVENFRTQTYVGSTIGFDFSQTWKYLKTSPYPVLKIVYDEKPRLVVSSVQNAQDTVTANVRIVSPSQNFTVILSVYDEHGKLMSLASTKFLNSAGTLKEFKLSCASGKYAHKIRISVIDNQTFSPLFKPITKGI